MGKKMTGNSKADAANAKKAAAKAEKDKAAAAKAEAAEAEQWNKGSKSNAKKEAEAERKVCPLFGLGCRQWTNRRLINPVPGRRCCQEG